MDLPINDKELEMIVWMSEHISGDGAEELHKKLKLVKELEMRTLAGLIKDTREKHGMVI